MNIQTVKNVRNSDLNKAIIMPLPLPLPVVAVFPARNAVISAEICARLVRLRDSTLPGDSTVVRLSPSSLVAMAAVLVDTSVVCI